jgi:type IV pilus assembly protein PilB
MPQEPSQETTKFAGAASAGRRVPIGEILIAEGLIKPAELEAALVYRQEKGVKLGQALIALHLVKQSDIARALRSQGKVHCVHLTPAIVDPDIAALLGEERSRKAQAIAINKIAGVITVAMEDPSELYNVDAISMHLGAPVFAVHSEPDHIDHCLNVVFKRVEENTGPSVDDILLRGDLVGSAVNLEAASEEDESSNNPELDGPVINMVRAVIEEAFSMGASDIHLEPRANIFCVRFRVDGMLQERVKLPKAWARPVLARLKILANLDIAERRLPQDGRAQAEIRSYRVDLRVATTPTLHGEGAVIRILDGGRKLLDLKSLALDERQLEDLTRMVEGGEGIVLATGPTGSGKTTTLYALLQHLNAPDTKIITVEDPVENQLEGATQINMNTKIGLNFARGLRSILRQDPDVVLVGEIRDEETAQIAVQAAMTGHIVLSTLHTNGAAESITRLRDMKIEPYLLADTLRGLCAQRLVRKICPNCKHAIDPKQGMLERLGLKRGDGQFYAGKGCDNCNGQGYKGRLAIYEVMRIDPSLASLVRRDAGVEALRNGAIEGGMATIRADGLRKALAGQTTLDEVYAATVRDS